MLQDAKLPKDNALWFSGVCDELYRKIDVWEKAYWLGDVHSTREWLHPTTGRSIPKPVKMAHVIPFRDVEFIHLIRILDSLRPGSALLEEIKILHKMWKHGKPVLGSRFKRSYWSQVPLPAGIHRALTVVFYPEHVKELLTVLDEAKHGKMERDDGKDLFES